MIKFRDEIKGNSIFLQVKKADISLESFLIINLSI